ncbi:MAG: histidine phosphatase family protein [Candidatus Latescibacterota bacterium]|nr:MAG: histidine phosphatase family protein [Candidatus Latescibacterota bacterium]
MRRTAVVRATMPGVSFILSGIACVALAPLGALRADPQVEPSVIFFVRHAEAAQDGTRDPSLSERGAERANALAEMLAAAEVTHLFASEYKRTQETLAPLAEQRELEVEVVLAREPEAQLEALRGLPAGSVAVVAGHSNTVPGLVEKLGGHVDDLVEHPRHGMMLDETHFHRMFVVMLQEGRSTRTLELHYGEPSDAEVAH